LAVLDEEQKLPPRIWSQRREPEEIIVSTATDMQTGATREASPEIKLDRALACLLLRATLGLNITLHGITRIFIGGVAQFVNTTLTQFQNTVLPAWQVRVFATAVPYMELVVGVLLLAGLWTRWALTAGALLMMALIFGTALRSEWTLLFLQMFYSFLYFVLLMCRQYDWFSADRLLRKA
jgi:thiosulfate dehydrogenase (quinone) large subunit